MRVHPADAKPFLVNYRADNGGRKAPNQAHGGGSCRRVTPDQARRQAQELLGRNGFIMVAERERMLSRSLTKCLVNQARPGDVTEGYAADWTVEH